MPVGDKQKLITDIVSTVIGQKPELNPSFDWFVNKHASQHFGMHYPLIDKIFKSLNGNVIANSNKRTINLECDAYFGGQYNFIFEFDEFQHFSTQRLQTLELYPTDLTVNFSIDEWKNFCRINKDKADRYRKSKTTTDFNFEGGRTAQRAYLDCFRDLLPQQHGLKPTLRINEFEAEGICANTKDSCNRIEKLLNRKLKF